MTLRFFVDELAPSAFTVIIFGYFPLLSPPPLVLSSSVFSDLSLRYLLLFLLFRDDFLRPLFMSPCYVLYIFFPPVIAPPLL